MNDPINELHKEFVSELRKALKLPDDWKYVASTFAAEPLAIIYDVPKEDIAIVSTTHNSRYPEAVRMTFFLSPAGIDRVRSACASAT